ncbi:NACHT domain-containing NTPase [Xanthomonas hortorum]|uniref:Vacuolar protein sorting-associated protein 35 n=1 Tax=Xanthomonas hortorum pv. hederae TaxID=453603 RepID=A0A9X4BVJ1_9XANT|nr:hypothetical protein [Xanthomonas hortorum]MDC8640399.1 vacuolar protein sorting-associated protein 35 [Xanthomonas hortorum pv. hederae]
MWSATILLQGIIEGVKASPYWAALALLGAVVGALATIPRLVNAVLDLESKWRSRRVADQIFRSSGVASFTSDDVLYAGRNYVVPNCMQTDPSNEDDLRTVVALGPLFQTIDDHFDAGGQKRHVILLADSGMGKTSFCINYYAREMKKRASKRRSVVIVSLGRGNAIEEIRRVANKRDTVCFLDAFDEDPSAAGNPSERLSELMGEAADFRNIVVTCRSQFFASDDAIPSGSGIMYVAARKAGQGRELPLHRLFLAPFSTNQIRTYLSKQFPLASVSNWRMRRQALALVATISELSTRPMLLELLPDLVRERRSISELFGLYEFLVEKWLERESGWIRPVDLREISVELAVRSYIQQRSGHGDRIAPSVIEELASAHQTPLETWKLKSRSLLNRDVAGRFKFAHRSVMEYLFLLAALAGDQRCFSVEWTDLMKDLFVSWGASDPRATNDCAMEILRMDHDRTGLFPLASPLKHPDLRSVADCRKLLKADGISFRQSRRIPVAWRNRSLRLTSSPTQAGVTSHMICDSSHGISWWVNDVSQLSREDERALYRDQRHSSHSFGKDSELEAKRRLPSIEEILSLWESEPYLTQERGVGAIFDRQEIYWLGDSGDNGPLCCSFGDPLDYAQLRLISSKIVDERAFHVYEFQNRFGYINREPFRAMAVYVANDS